MKKSIRFLALALLAALCLSMCPALADGQVTTTGSVHLRKGPGLDYKTVCTIDDGVTLSYDKTDVDDRGVTWYHVKYSGHKGWVSSMYAKQKSSPDNLVTTTGSLYLRKGPGLDYVDICAIGEGVTLSYDKTEKDDRGVTWYHVKYNGNKGWISSKYAKKGSGSSDSRVTTTGSLFLREGPGLDYDNICAIGEGVTLSYDKTEKDDRGVTWYHVKYNGHKGWISSKYAKKGSGSSDSRVTTTGSLFLREGPGLDYDDICAIGEGVTLSYDRTEKDERGVTWYHVKYNGHKGWVSGRYARVR